MPARTAVTLLACTLAVLACSSCKSQPDDGAQPTAAPPPLPVASAPSATPPKDSSSTPGEAPLAFRWKTPCRVPVEERRKAESDSTLRFDLSVMPEAGGNLEVRFENMDMVEYNGERMNPALEARMAPALALMTVLPSLIVTTEGRYVEARGMDEAMEALLASGIFKNEPKVADVLRSPRAKKAISDKTGDSYWRVWVGMWIGVKLAPGEKREFVRDGPLLGDEKGAQQVRIEHMGDTGDGHVRLSCTTTGDMNEKMFAAFMKDIGGPNIPGDAGAIRLHRVAHIEVETDPWDLRPSYTRLDIHDVVEMDGGREARKEQTEIREDRFDWAKATGCF